MNKEQLIQVAAPNLPRMGPTYQQPTQEQFGYTLRTFFTRLVSVVNSVTGSFGGRFVDCPNGLFFDLGAYSPAVANTGYPLEFKVAYLSHGISVVDDTKITVEYGGVYNFQYSSALTSTNSSLKTVWVWISRNGQAIQYTTNEYTISGSGTDTIISWNFNIDLDVGEYVELYWAANDTNVSISTAAPTPPHTGIPANVVAVNFIAPLPDPRPTPP